MKLINDKYDGVIIENPFESEDLIEFEKELNKIIQNLKDKKLLWIKVPIQKSIIIPTLTKYNFVFYHCNENDILMLKKLIGNSIIPTAFNHTVGVGAVVIYDNKLLLVKDRIWKRFKLPGGYVDDKENISQALKREVFEETGIKIELESINSLAHSSKSQFDKSNLYIVCKAKALSNEINSIDFDEIIEAKWMDIEEFFESSDIHIYNKNIVKACINNKGLKLEDFDYFKGLSSGNHREYYF